jgi:hypothetical protein
LVRRLCSGSDSEAGNCAAALLEADPVTKNRAVAMRQIERMVFSEKRMNREEVKPRTRVDRENTLEVPDCDAGIVAYRRLLRDGPSCLFYDRL